MSHIKKIFTRLLYDVTGKNLALWSLIILLMLLLLQSGFSMFFVAVEIEQLDIIFRTALSSIFGFFISILASGKTKQPKSNTPKIPETPEIPGVDEASEPIHKNVNIEKKRSVRLNVQILILTVICVYCLISIMIVRNFPHVIVGGDSASSTISLYRDFLSGGIGALIGLTK